jgi:hypothetical protein
MNMKIIMTAIPEMGHFTPLMRLGKYLADKGHEIHFVTFAYHKQKVENMIKTTEVKCQPHFFDEDDPMPRECMFNGLTWKKDGVKRVNCEGFEEFYPKICATLNAIGGDLMICDVVSSVFGNCAK